MNLSKLLEKLSYTLVSGSVETQVESLTSDSRKVRENTAFVCIVGAVSDGHTYIQAAVEQKASVIVVQQGCKEEYLAQIPDTVTVVSVENTRYALAFMSAAYFDDPAEKLFTIGITGTKGKTTTTYMIRNVLEACGIKTGLIGTIETIIGDESWASCNTTPESYQIHESFAKMVKAGCKAVVMEVSSQGLKLDRTAGILFDIGVFTNLEPDHIGPNEHASFEEYLACKAKLFAEARAAFFAWVREQYETFIEYRFVGDTTQNDKSKQYELTQLPDGFFETNRMESKGNAVVIYQNGSGKTIQFTYSQGDDSISLFLESNTSDVQIVRIGNIDAEFYLSSDPDISNGLVWQSEDRNTFFCITSTLPQEVMLRLAESVQAKK